jgi:hypothetical protein
MRIILAAVFTMMTMMKMTKGVMRVQMTIRVMILIVIHLIQTNKITLKIKLKVMFCGNI